jgi:hypothetical protein
MGVLLPYPRPDAGTSSDVHFIPEYCIAQSVNSAERRRAIPVSSSSGIVNCVSLRYNGEDLSLLMHSQNMPLPWAESKRRRGKHKKKGQRFHVARVGRVGWWVVGVDHYMNWM